MAISILGQTSIVTKKKVNKQIRVCLWMNCLSVKCYKILWRFLLTDSYQLQTHQYTWMTRFITDLQMDFLLLTDSFDTHKISWLINVLWILSKSDKCLSANDAFIIPSRIFCADKQWLALNIHVNFGTWPCEWSLCSEKFKLTKFLSMFITVRVCLSLKQSVGKWPCLLGIMHLVCW